MFDSKILGYLFNQSMRRNLQCAIMKIDLKVHQCIFENLPISSSSYKSNVEDFTFKHLLLFEICARKIREKFVYKHSETTEYVKN